MDKPDQNDIGGEVAVNQRNLGGVHNRIVFWLCVATSCFHLWANALGVLPELQRNAIHFGLLVFIAYLLYPPFKGKNGSLALDYVLGGLAALTAVYLLLFEADLHARNQVPLPRDLIAAACALLLLLEITRRTTGWFIPTLALLFLTYATMWGNLVGGMWRFPGVSFERILYRMYFAPDGIFGTIATVSSTFVALFVLFGAFLIKSGAGDFILRVALALLGRTVGGPAKMAVCASGLLGSISGSAVANTVGSGSLTIPMMKRTGFSPTFAAAVEASASTGGQLMPPIMGAGAFIMSQWTQIPYLTIVAVSFVPALMYFLSVICFVHFRARREDIQTVDPSEIPKLIEVLREGWHFTIPLAALIGLLLYGFTPTFAAAAGTLTIVLTSWLRPSTRMTVADILDALALGTRNLLSTGVILLCAGIIVGVVLLVGIGIKFSLLIGSLAGGSIFLTIILIALASLILGMGLPVTASYIVLAVLAAPALTQLGVALLPAHLLIFWYSQDANVTPPVCLAAYSAAGIAGSDPIKTGFAAWKISKGLYIIPLLFCYTGILFQDGWLSGIQATLFGLLGLLAYAAAFEGFHRARIGTPTRLLYCAFGTALLFPNLISNIVGFVLLTAFYVFQFRTGRDPLTTPSS